MILQVNLGRDGLSGLQHRRFHDDEAMSRKHLLNEGQ
jgi:hypothetical protein